MRLEIPFEQRTPVEGANLTLEDRASSAARRPSPGTRLPPFSSERPDEWDSYKRPALLAAARSAAPARHPSPSSTAPVLALDALRANFAMTPRV